MGSNNILPAIKLSTIVSKKYMAVQLLGRGGYGLVYEVMKLNSPSIRYACKTELASIHNNLKAEWDLMTLLKESKSKHNIIGIEMGHERNYNYIIMHLVGPSLADIRKLIPKKKFSLYTTVVCSIQCFDSLHELHKNGYIHRDVKPSNFAIGLLGTEEEKLIHVLDFGICRKLFNDEKTLRKPRMKVPFRGTTQYCSLNVHMRLEPGRHDDFWSLLYMMIEFHLSNLPWESMTKEDSKKAKENKIEDLLSKCPIEFRYFRSHLLELSYSREPNYEKIRNLLCQLMTVNNFQPNKPLDWQAGGEHGSIFQTRSTGILQRKVTGREMMLEDILALPNNITILKEEDFPPPDETKPPEDNSTSKSDDTIPPDPNLKQKHSRPMSLTKKSSLNTLTYTKKVNKKVRNKRKAGRRK